jgi:hypothetical protein
VGGKRNFFVDSKLHYRLSAGLTQSSVFWIFLEEGGAANESLNHVQHAKDRRIVGVSRFQYQNEGKIVLKTRTAIPPFPAAIFPGDLIPVFFFFLDFFVGFFTFFGFLMFFLLFFSSFYAIFWKFLDLRDTVAFELNRKRLR